MAADATAQLIQRIKSQLSPDEVTSYENATNFVGTLDGVVGIAANYAQILSLAIPVSGGDAVAAAAASSALAGDTAEDVAAAAAGAASGGVGAVVIIFLSAVAGVLGTLLGSSGSTDPDQLFQAFETTLTDTFNAAVATYYQGKLMNAQNYWTNLYTDLNNLQLQGTGVNGPAPQVTGPLNQNEFIQDAQRMVNNLFDPGSGYWERPFFMELQFAAQTVPYFFVFSTLEYIPQTSPGWYGKLPQPQVRLSVITPGVEVVSDPNTMLPLAVWAIQAYLTIMEAAHEADPGEVGNPADPGQYTFQEFLQHYGPTDLAGYASFLYTQFTLAVGARGSGTDAPHGLVKTDVPSFEDVLSFIWYKAQQLSPFENWWPWPWWPPTPPSSLDAEGNQVPPNSVPGFPSPFAVTDDHAPTAGYGWNGVYGVADAFAPYPSSVAVPSTGPSCIVDLFNTDPLPELLSVLPPPEAGFDYQQWLQYHVQYFWTYPWLKTRLTLALMARWKALYLFHGHSATWAVIQHLDGLASQPPHAIPKLPDGTMASGNWSVRELFGIIEEGGPAASYGATELSSKDGTGYSVVRLVNVLNVLAKGDWGGYDENTTLSMPASFRDRLAAAALV